jgi:hypothetical protein
MLIYLVIMETFESETFKKLSEGPIAAFKQEKDAEKCVDYWTKYDRENGTPGLHTKFKVTTMYLI